MGNYIYYGYSSSRSTVTLEPAVKKVDTAISLSEVNHPRCEITTLEKVTAVTVPVEEKEVKEEPKKKVEVKEEPKKEEKEVEVKEEKKEEKEVEVKEEKKEEKEVEVKEEPKKEEKEVEVKEEPKKEEKEEPKKEEKEEPKKEEKKVEKTVIEFLKINVKEKAKSPLLPPVKEESVDVHPYLLEYGTAPIKSNTLLIQNQTYQVNNNNHNKKKNKKKD